MDYDEGTHRLVLIASIEQLFEQQDIPRREDSLVDSLSFREPTGLLALHHLRAFQVLAVRVANTMAMVHDIQGSGQYRVRTTGQQDSVFDL